MAVEADGVPTVAVHTHVFARLARNAARVNGTPTLRQAFVPQPVVGQTPAQLRAYIEGIDPVNKRPFVQELIEGLTRPLNEEDLAGVAFDRTTPRLLEPAGEEELRRRFEDERWTDYLPIVLPTEERVAAMLKGTRRKPDEVVGRMRPTNYREFWEYTVEKVAVNAVMAGARPEYFPVILAMAASGMTARQSSTTSWAAPAIVNGPIRNEIGMHCGIGAMGPYSHANVTIGRAHALLSQNLQGGSVVGDTYMGSIGNAYNVACTWAENEEKSPWEPLHVQHGFKPDESVVTVFLGGWYTMSGYGPRETWEQRFRHTLAACEPYSPPIVLLDPSVARGFVDRGF
ncbi:MAG: UGSC family (seleno)protein, partial [Rubrivivax sp.]